MSPAAPSNRPPIESYRSAPLLFDPFIGQRFVAAVVDICFFVVIALFGIRKVIGEVLIGTLLSSYAAYRFGVAQGKQQAVTAMHTSGAYGGGPGGSGGPGITSQSGSRYEAVRPPVRDGGQGGQGGQAHHFATIDDSHATETTFYDPTRPDAHEQADDADRMLMVSAALSRGR